MPRLFEIEQAIAARCGPFLAESVESVRANFNTVNSVTLPSLLSYVLPIGDQWTGMYILRRGLSVLPGQGYLARYTAEINNFPTQTAYDRVRRIVAYDVSTGTLSVDVDWYTLTSAYEQVELHTLHPTQELHPAAMAGLARCFRVDRVSVPTTSIATERDLTALVPWLTDPLQVYDVGYVYPGSFVLPQPVPFFRPYLQNGHVWLQVAPDPYPNDLLITARRPATMIAGSGTTFQISSITSYLEGHSGIQQYAKITTTTPNNFVDRSFVFIAGLTEYQTLNGLQQVARIPIGSLVTYDPSVFYVTIDLGFNGERGVVPGVTSGTVIEAIGGDLDEVAVPLDYAVAFGVVAAWQRCAYKLAPAAQAGMILPLAEAKDEATSQAIANFTPPERRIQFSTPFPSWQTSLL